MVTIAVVGLMAALPVPAGPRQPIVAAELTAEQYRAIWLRNVYSRPPGDWPPPVVDPSVKWVELGLRPAMKHPTENPYSEEKAKLGRQLFFDPRLSGSKKITCATCHSPDSGWAIDWKTSFGSDPGVIGRNPPGLLNSGFSTHFFWDGRADSLEEQARKAILNREEMDATEKLVTRRLQDVAEYREKFKRIFGADRITLGDVAKALATFERTLVGGESRFDAFLKGNTIALSDEAVFGLHLFRTKAGCMNCHYGPNFSDNQFHDLGLSYFGRKLEDLGRYYVTGRPADVGRFKTPTLRNVARTAPYMHNGRFHLKGVLKMHNAGMPTLRRKEHQKDDPLFPTKSPLLRPLNLTNTELHDLKAFLESLSEPGLL